MRTIKVLDKGYVKLVGMTVDFPDDGGMPDFNADAQISDAARTSYASGTKKVRSDDKLIDYLIRNSHDSPLEMPHFKFQAKMPLFVVQQLLRHRTANINQESFRYSQAQPEFYFPLASWRGQDAKNKQGSDGFIDEQEYADELYYDAAYKAFDNYESLLAVGVSREMARAILPVSTYTTLVWQQDLRNLLHLIKLRADSHAQPEIQEYAKAMLELIKPFAPQAIASWQKHRG